MKKITLRLIAGLIILGLQMLTWGAFMAAIQSIGNCQFSKNQYRQQLGMSLLVSLLPPLWFAHPMMTGFYEHGWSLSPRCQSAGVR